MEPDMPKRFNVAGPCVPDRHYLLPAVNRPPEARQLAEQGDYFVIHAAPASRGKPRCCGRWRGNSTPKGDSMRSIVHWRLRGKRTKRKRVQLSFLRY
jgi:hypothetical protein